MTANTNSCISDNLNNEFYKQRYNLRKSCEGIGQIIDSYVIYKTSRIMNGNTMRVVTQCLLLKYFYQNTDARISCKTLHRIMPPRNNRNLHDLHRPNFAHWTLLISISTICCCKSVKKLIQLVWFLYKKKNDHLNRSELSGTFIVIHIRNDVK